MKNRDRTEAHVRSASASAIRLRTWRDQVGKLDDNFALVETILIERPPIRDNEILGLDIAMEDKSTVAGGDSLTFGRTWKRSNGDG